MKINKAQLQNALEKVKPGLASVDLIEQTTSFAFLGDRVATYNDEISISHPVENLNVTGAVKAQSLYEFLNKTKKDEIDIEWEENQVVIKAGKSRAGLILEQEIKLPIEEEMGEFGKWAALPDDFIDALKFCYPCCSSDMSRPVLTCVHVNGKNVEASDSYQVVQYKMSDDVPLTKGVLIPASSVRDLVKYNVKLVAEGDNWIHFKTDEGTIFSSRIINNEFPEVEQHLKVEGAEFTFPKNTDQILQRANVFSKTDSCSGGIPMATVEIKGQRVKISASNQYGWFEEEARVKYTGDPVTFAVGVEFLLAMFGKLSQCVIGDIKIGFSGDNWRHVAVILVGEE